MIVHAWMPACELPVAGLFQAPQLVVVENVPLPPTSAVSSPEGEISSSVAHPITNRVRVRNDVLRCCMSVLLANPESVSVLGYAPRTAPCHTPSAGVTRGAHTPQARQRSGHPDVAPSQPHS